MFFVFLFHAFVPFCKRDGDVELGTDGPHVLCNLLTNGTICVARADEGKGGGTTVLRCTPVQKGGSHDLSLVSLGFLEALHTSVATLHDVSPNPLPGMCNHDAFVVVVHVQGCDFGVHQLKNLVQQLHPVQVLHASFGILNHLGAVRHVIDHLVEVAFSLVGGAVWGACDEVRVVLNVGTKTIFQVRVVRHVLWGDVVHLFAVLHGVNHGFARVGCCVYVFSLGAPTTLSRLCDFNFLYLLEKGICQNSTFLEKVDAKNNIKKGWWGRFCLGFVPFS